MKGMREKERFQDKAIIRKGEKEKERQNERKKETKEQKEDVEGKK